MGFLGVVIVVLLVGSIIFSCLVMCWGCGGLLGIVGDGGGRFEDPLGLHLLLLACFWWSLGCQFSGNWGLLQHFSVPCVFSEFC